MWGIAGNLDAKMIDSVAEYYAAQPPAPGRPGDPALIATGQRLFEMGVLTAAFPHARRATAQPPRALLPFFRDLAGQHAKYIYHQIEFIQGLVRKAPVMHGIIKDLTPDEMQAIAAYAQSK